MLDGIEALSALQHFGTISEAAVRLRLTQSAVSKRLRRLEAAVGFRILEPDGRKVRLTRRALELVERAKPLVAELRNLTRDPGAPEIASLSVALADSIASSWGPLAVSRALRALPDLRVDLHAHRSVLVVESVRLGRYHVGVCAAPAATPDLVVQPLVSEPMALVHSGLAARPDRRRALITIEPAAATYRAIEPLLRAHHPGLLSGYLVPVESFGAVVQMAKAGFGDGLVPLGLARGLPRSSYRVLSRVARRIVVVTRKTIADLPGFVSFAKELAKVAELS